MIWKGGSVYGDWLFFHPFVNDHTVPDGHTDHDFISTAFYAYSTSILANAARVLGKLMTHRLMMNCLIKSKCVYS